MLSASYTYCVVLLFLLGFSCGEVQVRPLDRLRTLSRSGQQGSRTVHPLATCSVSPLGANQVGFTTDNGCSASASDPAETGQVCEFTCADGYNNNDGVAPFGSYRCDENGNWLVAVPGACEPAVCPFPYLAPATGYTFGTCLTFQRVGDSCSFGCRAGFEPALGTSGDVSCEPSQTNARKAVFSTPTLVCEAAPCTTNPLPEQNAGFDNCVFDGDGEIASGLDCAVACQDGYQPFGSYSCLATEWIANENPRCVASTCSLPDLSADPLKTSGQCGQQATTTSQSCDLGCATGYAPEGAVTINCEADTDASSSTFSDTSYSCEDINECSISYPSACGLGWDCTNGVGNFSCAPQVAVLDYMVEADEFFRHYRHEKRYHHEGHTHERKSRNGEGEGESHRPNRSYPRVGEGEGRRDHKVDPDRERRIRQNRWNEQEADDQQHLYVGLKWPLGLPTVVTALELEVTENGDSETKQFSLVFENPQVKHVAIKAKRNSCYLFTLVVTTEMEGVQRSPTLTVLTSST